MNFSTTPPKDSISVLTVRWYGRSSACTSSGSNRSAREVKPTRSTKMTLTRRRSSRRARWVPVPNRGRPHRRQNLAISGFSWPQEVQTVTPQA
jgi:hypothetical protein